MWPIILFYFFCSIFLYYIYQSIDISYLVNKGYIYNQSWEDSDTDIDVYKLEKNNRILMITTGGDNVLNYLLTDPEFIDTIDMNKHQNYLLEMKMALIKTLEWDDCFSILAYSNYDLFKEKYPSLRLNLSYDAKKWWDKNIYIMRDFHKSGSVKMLVYILKVLFKVFFLEDYIKEIKTIDLEGQRSLYNKYKNRINFAGSILYNISKFFIPFIGVPVEQMNLSSLHCNEWLYRVLYQQKWSSNYFYFAYVYGHWTPKCCPAYLKEENYNFVKERLNKVRIFTNELKKINSLKFISNINKYNRINLLDHMDWMNEPQIIEEWKELLKCSTDDCKFCWRSFAFYQPFSSLQNINYEVSSNIFPNYSDRIGMYNSIHVATVDRTKPFSQIIQPQYKMDKFTKFKAFLNILTLPFIHIFQNKNKNFMNKYYSNQAKYYDAYRHEMLHGKFPLMSSIPWRPNMKILILAGGTGDILDYIKNIVCMMDKIVISDISTSMIDFANIRVKENNWTNVRCVCEDATEINTDEKYDLIIISYSLTMIPPWKKVIDKSIECLNEKGKLAVCDFTSSKKQFTVCKYLWKTMFSINHINLHDEYIPYLKSKLNTLFIRSNTGGFPFVPFLTLPYYYGLFSKK